MPSFLRHLTSIVRPRQGLLAAEDEGQFLHCGRAKDLILALTQFLESCRREKSLDLAERMYEAWRRTALEEGVSALQRTCMRASLRELAAILSESSWKSANELTQRPVPDTDRASEPLTTRIYAPLPVPRITNSPPRSSRRRAKELLSSQSSPPQSLTEAELASVRSADRPASKLHERLYQEAALKRHLASQMELFSIYHPLKSCTFRPKIDPLNARDRGNVHERYSSDRLYRENLRTKEMLQHYQRLELEVQGCTFTPRIAKTQPESPRPAESFNRLYEEAATKRQGLRELELQKSERDLMNCTFQPEIYSKTERSVQSESVHTNLHSDYTKHEHNVRKLQLESKAKELETAPFAPVLVSSSHNAGPTKGNQSAAQLETAHFRVRPQSADRPQRNK